MISHIQKLCTVIHTENNWVASGCYNVSDVHFIEKSL